MLVQTRAQFDAVVDCLKLTERVAVDTETNGLEVHKGHRLCGVAVYFQLQAPYTLGAYFPFRHAVGDNLFNRSENLPLGWLQELGRVLGREDLVTYWHNAKFDFGMLRAEGIEIAGPFFDTMVISTMIDENTSHKLGDIEQQFLGTSSKKNLIETNLKPYLKGKKDYSKVPSADMEAYAVNDTRVTFHIVEPLLQELAAQEQHTLWPDEMRFLRCLFDIEWNGILMDRDMAQQLSDQTQAKMRTLEDEMGFDPQKRAELARRLFASPPEGAGLPVPLRTTKDTSALFPAGLPVMDERTLLEYNHPLIAKVLEYRGCVKRNSTWYAGFLRHCDPGSRIHPIYNTAGERDDYGARTGRLTCGHPNIQQLPRDPTSFVRKLCLPPWRFRLVEFDYNQIEYRLAGVYADEEAIIEAYRAGSDMHQLTADKLGIPRVDPKGGLDGKKLNFTILYGGGPQRIADTIGGTLDEGKKIYGEFWKNYPKLKSLVRTCEDSARERGYIKLWNGSRNHFSQEWTYHKAFNSLIQGGAAKIVQRSMLMINPEKPYRIVAQIHDALQFYVPIDFYEEYVLEIKNIMEWPSSKFGIDFPVEYKDIHAGSDKHYCTEECLHDLALSSY